MSVKIRIDDRFYILSQTLINRIIPVDSLFFLLLTKKETSCRIAEWNDDNELVLQVPPDIFKIIITRMRLLNLCEGDSFVVDTTDTLNIAVAIATADFLGIISIFK